MKHLFFLIIMCFATQFVFAQKQIGFDTTIIGGKENQIYNYRNIKIDKLNSKYVVGFFKGIISIDTFTIFTKPYVTNNTFPSSQGIFIAKYDSNNKLLFLKKIIEGDSLFSFSFTIDSIQNQYFSITYSNKLYLNNDSIKSIGGNDGLLIKNNSNGDVTQLIKIGNLNGETISDAEVAIGEKYNYYLSGVYNATWTGISLNYQLVIGNDTLTANNQDMFIAKFDTSGTPIWAKSYGGGVGYSAESFSSFTYSNNYLYAIGNCLGPINFGGINLTYPANYISKCFMAKFDTNGNCIWVRKFGSSENLQSVRGNSVAVSGNNIYFTGGSFSNTQNVFLFEGGPTLVGHDQGDYFIACYDTAGNFKWNTISNSYGSEYITQLTTDSNSNVYGVGKIDYTTYFPNDTLYSYGSDDAFVCSYDSAGNYRWAIHGGGANADIGSGIALDNHQKIYIVGGTTSSNGCIMGNDTLYPTANQSTLFFSSIDSIAKINSPNFISSVEKETIKIYPNPNNGIFEIDIPNTDFNTIMVSDLLGKIIYHQSKKFQTKEKIVLPHVANGIYILQLKNDVKTITQKLNIIN